jgi:hypothetical protein
MLRFLLVRSRSLSSVDETSAEYEVFQSLSDMQKAVADAFAAEINKHSGSSLDSVKRVLACCNFHLQFKETKT